MKLFNTDVYLQGAVERVLQMRVNRGLGIKIFAMKSKEYILPDKVIKRELEKYRKKHS